MSQFISNTKNIENSPIFSLPTKEIVMPRIKKYIKGRPEDQKANYRKESKILINICERLQKEQFEEIHNQNAKQMEIKFGKLKKRINKSFQKESIEKIFNSELKAQKLNIRQIVKMRPKQIQLERKYGHQILLKMESYRQAEQISDLKTKYRNWYDTQKNDRCNSPILKKMTYLLQRATKQDILDELPIQRIYRHTTKEGKQNEFGDSSQDQLSKNSSPYKRRLVDWSSRRTKFSLLNPNYDY